MYHLFKSLYLHATSLPEYSILLLGLDGAGKTTFLNQVRNMYGAAAVKGDRLAVGSRGDGAPSENAGRTVPTVGQNVVTIQLPSLYLRIWDVGGQQSIRSLWKQYYSSCHAIVFLVDSSDIGDGNLNSLPTHSLSSPYHSTQSSRRQSRIYDNSVEDDDGRLGECAVVLSELLRDAGTAGVPLLVLANKQDREDSVEVVRIKEGFVRRVVEGEDVVMAGTPIEERGEGEGGLEGSERRGQGYVRDSRVLPCSALSGHGVKEAVEWVSTRAAWNKEARPPVMR